MNRAITVVFAALVCLVGAAIANPTEYVPAQTIASAPAACPVTPPTEDVGCAAEADVGCAGASEASAKGPVRRLGGRVKERVRNGIDRRQGRRQGRRERRQSRGGIFGC